MRFYPRQESRMTDVFIAKLDIGRGGDEKIVEFSFYSINSRVKVIRREKELFPPERIFNNHQTTEV